MKKYKMSLIMLCVLLLTGCGDVEMVQLTQEQEMQVTEYAAGLLLQDALNYETRLVDTEALLEQLAAEQEYQRQLDAKVEAMKNAQKNEKDEKEQMETETTQVVDASTGQTVVASLEEILDLEQVSIDYQGYEIVDSYPEDQGSLVFAMDATDGQRLFVLHFALSNLSDTEQSINLAQSGCRYRCSINGESYQSALSTLLLNDMSLYKEVLEAGQTEDVVLVWEVPGDQEVYQLNLMVKKDKEQIQLKLE